MEARRLQAGASPNPTVALEVDNFAGSQAYRGTDRAEYTLRLGQLIELGGKRSARIRQADMGGAAAAWDQESRRLMVLGTVAETFVELVGAQQRVVIVTNSLETAQSAVEAADERVRVGKAAPVEATRSRLVLTDARLSLARAQRHVATGRAHLAAMWGSSQPRFTSAVATLSDVAEPPSLDLLQARLAHHPDLERLHAEIERQRVGVEVERAKAIPDVSIGAGYRWFNEDGDHAFVASASIPLPVFDRNRGGIEEAEYRRSKARAERTAVEVRLSAELNAAYLKLRNAFNEASELGSDVLPTTQRILDDVEAGYRAGKFGYIDLLDAQRTFTTMQLQYIDATVDYHQAVIAIERLSGGS